MSDEPDAVALLLEQFPGGHPAADELIGLRSACNKLKAEIERLRVERDNWEAVCSGSIKEQFRLARENEARLKLALDQLDKAAAEIERLRALLDAARICFKNRDQSEREAAVYAEICRALEQARKE